MRDLNFFDDIKAEIQTPSEELMDIYDFNSEEHIVRDSIDALLCLEFYKEVAKDLAEVLNKIPSLESIFTREYGSVDSLFDREFIIESVYFEDFLFRETESYPIVDEGELRDLLDSYRHDFKSWLEKTEDNHNKTQAYFKESFAISKKDPEFLCRCFKCRSDIKNVFRDKVLEELKEFIIQEEDFFQEYILTGSINKVSDKVYKLKSNIDKRINKHKNQLKKASLNKLNSEAKIYFKDYFSPHSELGKVYKEKLLAFFNGVMDEEGVNLELVEPREFDRFFTFLGVNIWRNEAYLKREFQKFLNSLLQLKRKDISSTILKNYLGQFWIHAEARKKTRKIFYHMGPTNSGKTYHAIEALSKAKNGCYLAPLRLLASELYDTLNQKGVQTTLLTGEEVIENPGATHYSSTIEMAKLHEDFECCVIDEIQMITDDQRGWAWTRALININADEVHLCGDPSVLELVKKILKLTGDTLEIREYERKTNLLVEEKPIRLRDLRPNDALIVFSRRNALKYKRDLENLGYKVSIVYGRLSPEVRREQARKFDEGETQIMVSTDAIAMGMNLPVRRIVFSALSKFYDNKEFPLSFSEIKQIAGRAGRYLRFPTGFVNVLQKVEHGLNTVTESLNAVLEQKEMAMVGPDLEIYVSVNEALKENGLNELSLTEFLRLFNTMTFEDPFYCVDLKEMIEISEMVEGNDPHNNLSISEKFGFACAPVNLGLLDHVQYFNFILNKFVNNEFIVNEPIDDDAHDIDYLETSIKCVELYQWLARHFDNKNFSFDVDDLLENKSHAVERLNDLLSQKTSKKCSSCGVVLADEFKFNICEECFGEMKFRRRSPSYKKGGDSQGSSGKSRGTGRGSNRRSKKPVYKARGQ